MNFSKRNKIQMYLALRMVWTDFRPSISLVELNSESSLTKSFPLQRTKLLPTPHPLKHTSCPTQQAFTPPFHYKTSVMLVSSFGRCQWHEVVNCTVPMPHIGYCTLFDDPIPPLPQVICISFYSLCECCLHSISECVNWCSLTQSLPHNLALFSSSHYRCHVLVNVHCTTAIFTCCRNRRC